MTELAGYQIIYENKFLTPYYRIQKICSYHSYHPFNQICIKGLNISAYKWVISRSLSKIIFYKIKNKQCIVIIRPTDDFLQTITDLGFRESKFDKLLPLFHKLPIDIIRNINDFL